MRLLDGSLRLYGGDNKVPASRSSQGQSECKPSTNHYFWSKFGIQDILQSKKIMCAE